MISVVATLTKELTGTKSNRFLVQVLSLSAVCMLTYGNIVAQTARHQAELQSPDKHLVVNIAQKVSGEMVYSLRAGDKLLISGARLGLHLLRAGNGIKEVPSVKWGKVTRRSVNRVWKPVWGKRAVVPDVFNEAVIELNGYTLMARLYNNGLAFRYKGAVADRELTSFSFADDYTAWYYNGENANIGPEKLSAADGLRRPVMTVKADGDHYLAVHEADLRSGEPLMLRTEKGSTVFSVASKRADAWRVIMYGKTPGDLVDSHLIELLSPAPDTGRDFSWVRPGVALWDWRINGAISEDGFHYQMSWPSWKRMVDFASENGIHSLVLDANWYGPEFDKQADPTAGGKVAQVLRLIRYGKQKDVGIWLYLNDVGGKAFPLQQTLEQYGKWGAAGVKYGFMKGTPEEKNARARMITRICADNRLMVDFHDDPVHPYGQMRTWPNAVTREFCQAQSDAFKVFEPGTFVTAVFVNMLAGPLDMNNGAMDLEQKGRVDNPMPVPSTVTAEAARTLIVFSGATIIPDIPENYRKHPAILNFIRAEKMPWKESKTLSGEIGEYIVMARQAATGDWLVAAANNEKAREVHIDLGFLPKGRYKATIIQDGPNAGYRKSKESHTVTVKNNLEPEGHISVRLAPGGGSCILLHKT